MADTNYPVDHPLSNKIWAKGLWHEALKQTAITKRFIGDNSDSLIQVKTELKKSGGDRVRVGLRMQLTGAGVQGDATLEGNEEALVTYTDNVFIDQLRHAVRSAGKMSEQRVTFEVREEARLGLADWWADRLDAWFLNQLTGNTAVTDTRYTGNQATTAPSAGQLIGSGPNADVGEGSLSATTTFSLQLREIDRAVTIAKTQTPPIRPLTVDGEKKYVLFIHPYQTYQLRRDITANNFFDVWKAAMQGGRIGNNPILTGALAEYNQTLIYEDARVPVITGTPASGTASQFRRAVFCGAQAALMAVGRDTSASGADSPDMTWNEELFDYKNKLGVEAGMIAGAKKAVFNSQDFATLAISSYAPAV
jgi:N4-gp56 family major capsid protein